MDECNCKQLSLLNYFVVLAVTLVFFITIGYQFSQILARTEALISNKIDKKRKKEMKHSLLFPVTHM